MAEPAATVAMLTAVTPTLSGANTYNGGTTINAGTLLAANPSGSATGTDAVNVLSGATLGGSGAIAGMVVVRSGGMLDPGASLDAARLTLGNNVTLNAGAILGIELGGTAAGSGYSQVQVTGTLDLGLSNLRVTAISGFSLAVGQVFVIVQDTGGSETSGLFANTSANGTLYTDGSGNTFLVDYAANTDGGRVGNDVTLTVRSVVPEPSSWALLGLGSAGMCVAVLRRRTRA